MTTAAITTAVVAALAVAACMEAYDELANFFEEGACLPASNGSGGEAQPSRARPTSNPLMRRLMRRCVDAWLQAVATLHAL